MKQFHSRKAIFSLAAIAMFCGLLLTSAVCVSADDGYQKTVVGPMDGLDMKAKRIWIDDMVYLLASTVKVQGTSTKLGLITDLKQGETVRATLQPNSETPSIPYVILIERM